MFNKYQLRDRLVNRVVKHQTGKIHFQVWRKLRIHLGDQQRILIVDQLKHE
jgi:hypothetical protein